jgi:SAM-dependent MidA family methyltransferase
MAGTPSIELDAASPGDDETQVDAALRAELAASLAQRPEMSFSDFLELVLYHPRWGYYTRRSEIFGAKGDFQTAPHVHPLFGWTIARAVQREFEKRGSPANFTLVEVGPGSGYLMDDLWGYLRESGQEPKGWDVVLVERSESLQKLQRDQLAGRVPARWVRSVEELTPFSGVVIANEFLDALPFHRIVRRGSEWRELCVVSRDPEAKELSWKEVDITDPQLEHMLPRRAPQGTILEESPAALHWLEGLSQKMRKGLAIFFDYGDAQEELIDAHPEGTLQTFGKHQAGQDPFVKLGSRDITAWVDFTPLLAAAEGIGFEVDEVRPQAETLYEWGMTQVAEELSRSAGESSLEAVKARMAAKTFLFGYSTHHVLQLRK